jgi:DNA-binding XRE family transcriptional regulator
MLNDICSTHKRVSSAGFVLVPPPRKSKPRSPEHAALGAAIQQMREDAGFSQEALADASDVHITQIGGMERGVRNPSYATLLRVASALDSEVGELTALADRIREGDA